MATTSRPWEVLVAGLNDGAGLPVASGRVRWYSPGTLVAAVAYSDPACASPLAAPLVLNAQGQGVIYFLEPVRVIVKDAAEAITYYDDIAPLNRHDSVYVTHPSINAGAETTLEAFLGTLTGSLGANFSYQESVGATSRSYTTWLGELVVSVKDFGALGDGTTDDRNAIQTAITRVSARGGGWVYFPAGTYKITGAIGITDPRVSICGAGRGAAIIKNFSTSLNAITISNVFGASSGATIVQDISITANTTSSGKAIVAIAPASNRIIVRGVSVALHRTGIDLSAVTEGNVEGRSVVESTDDNAAAIGITVGTRGYVSHATVLDAASASGNGTGIVLGADARAEDCYVERFGVGMLLSGAGAQARSCKVDISNVAAAVGINITAGPSHVIACTVAGANNGAVGVVIGAAANVFLCSVVSTGSAAAGYSVSAGVTAFIVCSTAGGVTLTSELVTAATSIPTVLPALGGTLAHTSMTALPLRLNSLSVDSINATPVTITPDITAGRNIQLYGASSANAIAYTIAAHSTFTLSLGDVMFLTLWKKGANAITLTWAAQYLDVDGSALTSATVASGTAQSYTFRWGGTAWTLISYGAQPAI